MQKAIRTLRSGYLQATGKAYRSSPDADWRDLPEPRNHDPETRENEKKSEECKFNSHESPLAFEGFAPTLQSGNSKKGPSLISRRETGLRLVSGYSMQGLQSVPLWLTID